MLISIRGRATATVALSARTKIGLQIIPYFRDIITEIVVIRKGASTIAEDAYAVLHGLLISIPTFWGTREVTQIITLYVDHCVSTSNSAYPAMLSLVKALAKRAPSNVLLPALIDLWTSFTASLRTVKPIPITFAIF
ncbi:hypothetical protein H2248_002488 [Termitomyces sp. 'cryptogamus']|nr:hypothetical protein H2248_002488 [Termitomyces sp. 'cryptogamus']